MVIAHNKTAHNKTVRNKKDSNQALGKKHVTDATAVGGITISQY